MEEVGLSTVTLSLDKDFGEEAVLNERLKTKTKSSHFSQSQTTQEVPWAN